MKYERVSKIPMLLGEVEGKLEKYRTRWVNAINDEQREEILELVKPLKREKQILEAILKRQEQSASIDGESSTSLPEE